MMFKNKLEKHRILLASKSPRRHMLLKGLDIEFEVISNHTNEVWPDQLPVEQVPAYLAKLKSDQLIQELQKSEILITADTAVILNNDILNKPGSRKEAELMLMRMSGQVHDVITGVCLASCNKQLVFEDKTRVYFKKFDPMEIAYYLDHYEPYDKAGSYGAQEWIGYIGIEKLEGCYFNVMGLPVRLVYENLLKFIAK